jgi:hypothetical protein
MGQAGWFRDRGYREQDGVPAAAGAVAATPAAGELGLTTNGLTGSLQLGRAHVRGAYYERTGSAWAYTHPTNTNANPRIDTYVIRRDLAAGTCVPAVLQGTPAATPAAVALTQVEDGVWEFPLHDVTVPSNSGTVLTVADRRRFLGNGQPVRLTLSGTWQHWADSHPAPPYERLQYLVDGTTVRITGLIGTSAAIAASTQSVIAALPVPITPPARVVRSAFLSATSTRIRVDVIPSTDATGGGPSVLSMQPQPAAIAAGTDYLAFDLTYSLVNNV